MAHGDIMHTEIPVSDFDRASAFYADLFGWEIVDTPGMPDYPTWMAPNRISGGALTARGDGFTQPRSYVEVDSIDDVVAKTTAGGGSVLVPKDNITETSWWAVIADPEGNQIGLFEGTMD